MSSFPKKGPTKRKNIHIPNTPKEIENEAEIIGIIMGDGHINQKSAYLRLRVREKDFTENFSNLIRKTYGVKAPIFKKQYYESYVFSTLLVKRISYLTKNNKEIPKFILNGSKEAKARFIRGFVDSEGSVDVIYNRRQIVVTHSNIKFLNQIKDMLLDIGIQSKYVKKRFGSDKLIISLLENLEKYNKYIGFSIKEKEKKLVKALIYLRKYKPHDKEKYWEVLRHWVKSKKSLRASAKEMSINWETYRTWIYGMKMPCQIKKDIEFGWVPKDYNKLRDKYSFLPLTRTS